MPAPGAKLPYDNAAIASWCAGQGFSVNVRHIVGDGALNVHWLVEDRRDNRSLVFRHRAEGHWLGEMVGQRASQGIGRGGGRGFLGEALALSQARRAGVQVPEVLAADQSGMLMSCVEGSAEREPVLSLAAESLDFRKSLIATVLRLRQQTRVVFEGSGREAWLAMVINAYCLGQTPWLDRLQQPQRARAVMARARAQSFDALCLNHGDFRTGNLMIDKGQLSALVDWEFAGYRPVEADVGWMLSSPWRYARPDLAASGLMSRKELLAGLNQPDSPRLRAWEALALVRWAVIGRLQDSRQGRPAGSNADEAALLDEAEALV